MLELPADATRQYIDAVATFEAYEEALAEAAKVRGGMYSARGPMAAPDDAYLVRTTASGSEKSLGRRSPETEAMYASFRQRKELAELRRDGLKASLSKNKRMNRALRVGRVAPIIVDILNRLAVTKLGEHFAWSAPTHSTLTNRRRALSLKTMRWRHATLTCFGMSEKRVAFATALSKVDMSMLGVLQKVDPTFRIRNSKKYTAVNKDGFEVDIIRREQAIGDPHPIRLSNDNEDFWVAQAPRAQELLDSPPFSAVIVATNGDMARMNTLDPTAFVRFKQWMSALPERDPLKRRRDALQAKAVEEVVQEYLPHWAR